MLKLSPQHIEKYRQDSFSLAPGERLTSVEQAIEFANRRGFLYFWPISGITLPSLWAAVAGDRPVADAHDDPGHVTWGWKDSLLGQRRWYYAKVLRKKATIISLDIAPYFYALSENYGAPEEDYLTQYEQGRLTQEARTVYEALLEGGPMHTIDLRKAAWMTSRESDSRFNKALVDLQADFKVVPVGVARAGAWKYAFIYDLTARHFPDLPEQAHPISESSARQKLAELYFLSVGAASLKDVLRLFGWERPFAERALSALQSAGRLAYPVYQGGEEVFALPELVD